MELILQCYRSSKSSGLKRNEVILIAIIESLND